MAEIHKQPFYDPDSRYWELKSLEARRTFDKLPITDEAWQVFQTFLEDEYVPAIVAQRGSNPTWHETEMPFRFALQLWNEGERSTITIVEKVRTKFRRMSIGVWNEYANK